MPSLSVYHHTWFSLTLDMGYVFMAAPAKCSILNTPEKAVFLNNPEKAQEPSSSSLSPLAPKYPKLTELSFYLSAFPLLPPKSLPLPPKGLKLNK